MKISKVLIECVLPGLTFTYNVNFGLHVSVVWVMANAGPTFVQNMKHSSQPLGPLEYFGYGLWCLGFFLESVSDHQKFTFRLDLKNKVS